MHYHSARTKRKNDVYKTNRAAVKKLKEDNNLEGLVDNPASKKGWQGYQQLKTYWNLHGMDTSAIDPELLLANKGLRTLGFVGTDVCLRSTVELIQLNMKAASANAVREFMEITYDLTMH